jgi:hypothetical protein
MILLLINFMWGAVFTNGPLMYKRIIFFRIVAKLKVNNNDYIFHRPLSDRFIISLESKTSCNIEAPPKLILRTN